MKRVLALCMLLLVTKVFYAQEIDIDWSKPIVCDNKNFGFFSEFIGSNAEYVYAKYTNMSYSAKNKNSSVRIVAYDKETMKPVKDRIITGFKSEASKSKTYADKTYYGEAVFDDVIMIFWKQKKDKKTAMYAEVYGPDLKPVEKLTKVYDAKEEDAALYIRYNKKAGSSVVIINPTFDKDGEILLDYVKVKSDLNTDTKDIVKLPFEREEDLKQVSIAGSYSMEPDGKIYALCSIKQNDRKLIKRTTKSASFIAEINPDKGDKIVYDATIESENKAILSKDYTISGGVIYVYGFYRNMDEKDKRGNSGADGVFISKASKAKEGLDDLKYTEFTKSFIEQLFADDPETKAKNDKKKPTKKKDKDKDDDGIAWTYEVEQSRIINNDVVMICTQEYNYAVTTCDGNGRCTTRYYCQKSDVTSIRMNLKGDIVWASNLDRRITYSGWNIPDIELIQKNNSLYITYGNTFMEKTADQKRKKSKSRELLRDEFEYAILNLTNGEIEKHTYRVNKPNAEKADRKNVGARGIVVVDNEMYVNSIRYKLDWSKSYWCLIPCFGFYHFMYSPNTKKGEGYLGHITTE
jgi:hypothetical protein